MAATDVLTVAYTGPRDRFHVSIPADAIAELLQPWSGKRRAYLVGLLNGCTKKLSAARAGVTPRATQLWAKSDAAFAEAVQSAEEMGFASIVEPELYARALDRSNPGSLRALEIVLRSRSAEYRQVSLASRVRR